MEIKPDRPDSTRGPSERFTGEVWLDEIAGAEGPTSRAQLLSVHFSPGARTAWHRHPHGQVLHVTEGEGRAQTKGGPVKTIGPATRSTSTPTRSTGTGPPPPPS